jgi:hypothetical protein
LDAASRKSYPGTGNVWRDLSGNGNDGTLTNGPTFSGTNTGSLTFNGTNQYATINTLSNLQNQDFTISTWIYPNSQNYPTVCMIDFDHATLPFQGWVLQSEDANTNRNFYLGWYDGTQFQPVGGFGAGKGIQINLSGWQNIVYSKNGTSLLGYKNNSQSYSHTATNANVSYQSNRSLRIGTTIISYSRYFNGNISQTLIYNRGLSPTEIQQNFNATRGRYNL